MKKILIFLTAVLFSIPLISGFVHAADVVPTSDTTTDFQNRLNALIAVFQLTETEIRDLQLRLASLERPTEPEFGLVYTTLEDNLEDYLDLTTSRIEELSSGYITLPGVLTTANNLNNWRKTVYDPATRELFDFLLLQQGGAILDIVEARYEKVATDVENLQISVAPEKGEAFKVMLQDARARVENAKLLQVEARTMFLTAFQSRHDELSSKFTRLMKNKVITSAVNTPNPALVGNVMLVDASVAEVKEQTIIDTIDLTKETVQTLMQRVINEITAAYQVFLQMRDLVHQK